MSYHKHTLLQDMLRTLKLCSLVFHQTNLHLSLNTISTNCLTYPQTRNSTIQIPYRILNSSICETRWVMIPSLRKFRRWTKSGCLPDGTYSFRSFYGVLQNAQLVLIMHGSYFWLWSTWFTPIQILILGTSSGPNSFYSLTLALAPKTFCEFNLTENESQFNAELESILER